MVRISYNFYFSGVIRWFFFKPCRSIKTMISSRARAKWRAGGIRPEDLVPALASDQWSSNTWKPSKKLLENASSGFTSKVSDLVGLGWGLECVFFKNFLGDVLASQLGFQGEAGGTLRLGQHTNFYSFIYLSGTTQLGGRWALRGDAGTQG